MHTIILALIGCFAARCCAGANGGPPPFGQTVDYQRITTLNPFRLVRATEPPLAQTNAVSVGSLPNLRLSGLAASASKRLAYFAQNERGNSPQYFTLAEGQSDQGVELLAIDIFGEAVTIRREGTELQLSLKSNAPEPNLSKPAIKLTVWSGSGLESALEEHRPREGPQPKRPRAQ